MATAQDVLKTLVKLEGGSTYISGMSAVAQADKSAAEQHLKLMDGYRKAQGVMAGLAAGAALGIGYVAKQADAFDQYRNKLEIATKSAEKAGKIFSWAQNYANATPFETGQVVDAAARLEMYGMTAQKWLPLAGDMAGAMGKDITQAVEAIADAISGGGLERLKEFGISSSQLKKAGWTGSYQDEAGLSSLKKALADMMGERYMGGTAKMAGTLSGKLSTLRGEFSTLAAEIGGDVKGDLSRLTDAGTALIRWLKELGPVGRQVAADLLGISAVGGTVGVVVVQYRMMQAQLGVYRALTQQVAAAEKQQAAAVRETTAALEQKAVATKAVPAGSAGGVRGGALGSLGQGGFGTLPGNWGIAQQTAGFTMGAMSLGRIDWSGEWDSASENVQNLGRTAGYVAGAFNPLILGATAAGDALSKIVDAVAESRLQEAERKAAIPVGLGPGGEALTREEMVKAYNERRRDLNAAMPIYTLPGSPGYAPGDKWAEMTPIDKYIKLGERNQRQAAQRKQRAASSVAAQSDLDRLTGEIGSAGVARTVAGARLSDLQDQFRDPSEQLANAAKLREASKELQATYEREARLQEQVAQTLREKAAVTDSAKEKAKLYADAEKAAAESIQSGIAAQKTARDADRAYTEAVQKDADARAKAQEDSAKRYQDALKAIEDAQRQRIDAASSQMGLIEAVFGKSSEAAAKAHASMSQLLQKEAMQSAQLGDTTGAYKLATQAVNEFRASQEALLGVMTNSLQVGDAYTQYLEAIGMKDEADKYRRQVLAGQQAGIARTLFSQGDWQGGFQAAASAETLARAGSDSKKDLFGSSVTRRGALTNAMDASAMQALRQGPVIVQPQVTLGLQDGFVNADKLKVKVERGQRFEIFAH